MSRRKRVVIPGLPHHVTQRGVRRQNTFFKDSDREMYLALLSENARRHGCELIAYCLMLNHVHHLVVPLEEDSLRWTFQYTHQRYAYYANGINGWSGHMWQEKFYSSPVDDDFFWITLRYIERNPVEAGVVKHAAQYKWSSAKARCNIQKDPILTTNEYWNQKLDSKSNWYDWLDLRDSSEQLSLLRNRTSRDLPTGSDLFLDSLEQKYGVVAHPPKKGRPKKGGK